MNYNIKFQHRFISYNMKWNSHRSLFFNKIVSSRENYKLIHTGNRSYLLLKYQKVLCSAREQNPAINSQLVINIQTRNFSNSWINDFTIAQFKFFRDISGSGVVEKSMKALQGVHDYMHIPWWLSIVLSTAMLRFAITFPLAVYQNYILAKLENLKPEMDELVKELTRETAVAIKKFNWDQNHTRMMYNRSARRIWKELIIRDNCHPAKASLLVLFQLPMWIIVSFSYRNLTSMMPHQDENAQIVFAELSREGFGWLPNLTDIDHSFILPVAMCLCNILIVDITSSSRARVETKRSKILTYFFKSVSIILLPIAASVPGCLVLYWTTSSFCGLAQNLLLMNPRVRRSFGIPITPSERPNPYQHLWETLQKKYLFKGSIENK